MQFALLPLLNAGARLSVEDLQATDEYSYVTDTYSQAPDEHSQATDADSHVRDAHSQTSDADSQVADGHSQVRDCHSQARDAHSHIRDEDSHTAREDKQITDADAQAAEAGSQREARRSRLPSGQTTITNSKKLQGDFHKMEASQRRKLNQAQAESAFMKNNGADFPNNSPGDKTAKALDAQIEKFTMLAGEQDSQTKRSQIAVKNDLFDALEVWMQKINRAAVALEDEIPGIRDTFRMPRNRSEDARIAAARNFF